jgi:monovalent cation:H+ antiporter-2, CPA2 family
MDAAHELVPVIVLLSAGLLGVLLMQLFKMTSILGYFLAGILIGPHIFGVVAESELIIFLAELGVVFLMFDIGLHLSLERLWEGRRQFLGYGLGQMGGAGLLFFAVALALGQSLEASFIIAGGLALSSTAIVLQLLSEQEETTSPVGRSATHILIFQDIAVVFLLILVMVLSDSTVSLIHSLGLALIKAIAVLVIVFLIGQYLLKPVLSWINHFNSMELFTTAILLIVLGTAAATGFAGLSLPLGAFLAGLMISETEFRYQVQAEIQPFRNLLLGLFFITVGLALDLSIIAEYAFTVAAMVLVLFIFKISTLWLVARLSGGSPSFSMRLAILLGQGGEFALVLFGVAVQDRLLDHLTAQLLMATIGISFILTPFLVQFSHRLACRLAQTECDITVDNVCRGRVFIAGFGRVGQILARVLETESIAYTALDRDRERIAKGLSEGFNVAFGDPVQPKILTSAGAEKASAIVIAIDNMSCTKSIVDWLKQKHQQIPIFIHTCNPDDLEHLKRINAKIIIDVDTSGYALCSAVLKHFNVSEAQIEAHLRLLKAEAEHDLEYLQQRFG